MKLTVLGSGTFFIDKSVTASSFLIESKDKKILIDCGPGTLVKLAQVGISLEQLDYIFLTHFHPDHSSDLFPLFMDFRLSDIFAPGSISKYPTFWGPKGIDKFLLEYSHLTQLHAYEGYENIKVKEYTEKIKIGGITVKTFKVVHNAFGTKAVAYALRFEIDNMVITFSGDCGNCIGIQKACKGANLFVCDASFPKDNKINDIHMNTTEIGEISQKGKVKKILLTHFYPQYSKYDLIKEVKEIYKGEVIKAKDLDTYKL